MNEEEHERHAHRQDATIRQFEHSNHAQTDHKRLQVNLTIHPLASLLIAGLVCLILFVTWAVYAIAHHEDFIQQSLGLMHDGLWVVKAVVFMGLIWLSVLIVGQFITRVVHPLIDAVHAGLIAIGQVKRNKVLAKMEQYAIFEDATGEAQFHQVNQERTTYNYRGEMNPPAQNAALPPPRVYYARTLYDDGSILKAIQEGKIIMGYGDTGQLLRLARSKYFSTIDAGIPSSGKTTTAYWQVAQQIIVNGHLIVIDPHMHYTSEDGEKSLAQELAPFADSFVFPPCDASLSGPIMQRVKYMRSLIDKRKQPGYIAKVSDTVLLVMDECNSVFDLTDIREELADDLAYIQREGRKYNVHTMLIGHRFSKDDIGSVKIRTIASTVMVHRFNDENQAGLLLGKSNAKKALTLHPGSYWFSSINSLQGEDGIAEIGPVRVQTPMISAADAPWILELKRRVTVLLASMESETSTSTSAPTTGRLSDDYHTEQYGSQKTQGEEPLEADIVDGSVEFPHAQRMKMLQLMELDSRKTNQKDIISQMWGPEYTEGRKFYQAQAELAELRSLMAHYMRKQMEV